MTKHAALPEPIVAAEFWANRRGESVRVQLREFEGAALVDVRKHYTGADGKLQPTKKGLSLAIRGLPRVSRSHQQSTREGKTARPGRRRGRVMTARPLQLITSGQRRVADVRLAAELEIDPPRKIRCWIALHKRQLQQTGGYLHFTVSDRVKEYFLNSDQAILLV